MEMLEKTAHQWAEVPAGADVGEAVITAMTAGGVDHLFFTSGAEIVWFQEAIAKAHALGRPAPRLITMTHEHTSLNAAIGYAAASGKPVATAVHVDTGTYQLRRCDPHGEARRPAGDDHGGHAAGRRIRGR